MKIGKKVTLEKSYGYADMGYLSIYNNSAFMRRLPWKWEIEAVHVAAKGRNLYDIKGREGEAHLRISQGTT